MGPGTQPSKPAATKPAPAPPATQPQKQATQAKTDCPLAVVKPCDVDTLNVQVTHKVDIPGAPTPAGTTPGSLAEETIFAQVTKRRRQEKIQFRGKDARDGALGAYDLVIETIADYNAAETPKSESFADPGDIVLLKKVQAGFTTPTCPEHRHALLTINGKRAPEIKNAIVLHREGVNNLTHSETHKLFGPTFAFDVAKMGTGAFVLFEWVISLFNAAYPKEIEIVAQGCGKRTKDDARPRNSDLRALLRVHRRDKWAIGVKIPPIGQFAYERARDDGALVTKTTTGVAGRVTERQVTTNTAAGGLRTNSVGTRDIIQDRRTNTNFEQGGAYGSQQSTERINRFGDKEKGKRLVGYKQIKDKLATPSTDFQLVFSRNDREIGGAELMEALRQVKENINKLSNAIAEIRNLFKKLPQAGFKFEFDLKVLTGYAVVEWGPKNAKPINDRYWPVYTQFRLKFLMEIVNVKLTLSFGIDVTTGGERWKTGLVVKIEGGIQFKISIDKEFSGDSGTGPTTFGVAGDCTANLTPYATAYAAGYTLADARAELSSGLEFKGQFIIDLPKKNFGLKGEIKSKSLVLTGSIKAPWWSSPRAMDPKEFLQGTTVYTFK